mmetsp:Transcript_42916/g.110781  ORF Transcript_42916/g.110781 Transcript_42916/m.110781 type:complete len:257 (+) Transcript_42916:2351-3121(+)
MRASFASTSASYFLSISLLSTYATLCLLCHASASCTTAAKVSSSRSPLRASLSPQVPSFAAAFKYLSSATTQLVMAVKDFCCSSTPFFPLFPFIDAPFTKGLLPLLDREEGESPPPEKLRTRPLCRKLSKPEKALLGRSLSARKAEAACRPSIRPSYARRSKNAMSSTGERRSFSVNHLNLFPPLAPSPSSLSSAVVLPSSPSCSTAACPLSSYARLTLIENSSAESGWSLMEENCSSPLANPSTVTCRGKPIACG